MPCVILRLYYLKDLFRGSKAKPKLPAPDDGNPGDKLHGHRAEFVPRTAKRTSGVVATAVRISQVRRYVRFTTAVLRRYQTYQILITIPGLKASSP